MEEYKEDNGVYFVYNKYFKSRIIIGMVGVLICHVVIMFSEIVYLSYARILLGHNEAPGRNQAVQSMMESLPGVFSSQRILATRGMFLRCIAILSKVGDFLVLLAFFSHQIRESIMARIRNRSSIIKINCSHIKEADVNFLVLALFCLGLKNMLADWAVSKKKDLVDLLVNLFILVFRCTIILPVLVWMFSSVYNKTRWGLVICAYAAMVLLIFIANCTNIIPDMLDDMEVIPHSIFGKKLGDEIERLNLKNKIYWDKSPQPENAALVKTGQNRYVIVLGDLIKYGKKEFVSFIAHEVGHADDYSTEKKLLATLATLGITCGAIVSVVHYITPKYESRGVSKFSVLVFVLLANMLMVSLLTNMVYKNLGILAEVNADLYAKALGFGAYLAKGLFHLTADNNGAMFHSLMYTHYMQDHPTIASRVSYLRNSAGSTLGPMPSAH
ncbi:STE24 endopeptidase [Nematocida sp. AWRm77]|nr:STE24 endopeptidase [Nematocida sp. AWRm77]